ncbi:MAG: hypothetical protein ACE5HV_03775 [Acidobacteriota bacterium]
MGEPRGKLEQLIADLEAKKSEKLAALKEYDLMLPHLYRSLQALDEAGIVESEGPAEAPPVEQPVAAPEPVAEEAEKVPEPARRSIASLVGDDPAAAKGKGK